MQLVVMVVGRVVAVATDRMAAKLTGQVALT